MDIETAAKQLKSLGHQTRLQIYRTLIRAGPDGLPVGGIQERLGVPGSTLSHHLHRLTLMGLVTRERHTTSLICRANYAAMNDLIGFLADECCVDAAAASEADPACAERS